MIDFQQNDAMGSRVILCDIDQWDHNETTFKWRNNYKIWKWCRQNDLLMKESHKEWFDKIAKDPTIKMYSIQGANGFLGVCGLTDIDRVNQRAEFSLYIAPDYQGRGYATAALKTLLSHGFMNQNLNVIWGETF
jgi:RimJ/RimL family protein N-acetyltransferase